MCYNAVVIIIIVSWDKCVSHYTLYPNMYSCSGAKSSTAAATSKWVELCAFIARWQKRQQQHQLRRYTQFGCIVDNQMRVIILVGHIYFACSICLYINVCKAFSLCFQLISSSSSSSNVTSSSSVHSARIKKYIAMCSRN